jgi:membrane-bound lytic murein transglycosylase A
VKKVAGKVRRGGRRLVSFYDRAAIEDGVLKGRDLEIVYLKDPVDSFFIQIQGSARVKLPDGTLMRVNYESQNGHPYYAVGKWLIDKKIYTKEEMSMDRIRQWMTANPDEGKELRRLNKSYVFFRETGLAADIEPVGAQGVSLTAGRSLAVDRNLHVYGTPFFIQAELPIDSEEPTTKWRRLMFAQDTGGAIVGPARADIYYGAGEPAGMISGRFKQPGQFTMLFPKSVDPFSRDDEDEEIPLPRPRPDSIPQAEVPATKPEVVAAVQAAVPLPVARPELKPEAKKPDATKTANVKPAKAEPKPKAGETKPAEAKPAAKKKPEPKKESKKSAKPVEPAPPS